MQAAPARAKGAARPTRLATRALSPWARPGRGGLAAVARDLAGPASEASSLRLGDRLTCPPRRRWSARRSRGPRCAEEETLALGTPGRGGVSRKEDYLSGGCGAQKEAADFPSETEEAEEGRVSRRRGVPTPGGSRAGTRRRRPGAGAAGGRAAWRTGGGHRCKAGEVPCLSRLQVLQSRCCQVPAPSLSPGWWRGKAR